MTFTVHLILGHYVNNRRPTIYITSANKVSNMAARVVQLVVTTLAYDTAAVAAIVGQSGKRWVLSPYTFVMVLYEVCSSGGAGGTGV